MFVWLIQSHSSLFALFLLVQVHSQADLRALISACTHWRPAGIRVMVIRGLKPESEVVILRQYYYYFGLQSSNSRSPRPGFLRGRTCVKVDDVVINLQQKSSTVRYIRRRAPRFPPVV
ncbi:uncharacterized protein EDB93DRAFT_1129535 [Suillus bovinus]|uniref:uncharacterized protein n=1 Tax=Suillus bovinus TaxID=48563 RepID=UPI001B87E182|nr:uncharacterized protein EDB93DRAFT_1129535 [Suillus bovinus]KAG2155225.1 hypothetical protein EDB93DRAFT_1129535 [Suillus bovinus]